MTDYIKREDAEGTIRYFFSVDNLFIDKGAEVRRLTNEEKCDEAFKYIEHLSTADVAPVRHGRWEGCKGDITCSACGEYALFDSEDIEMQYRTLYCPFCGAKMDE